MPDFSEKIQNITRFISESNEFTGTSPVSVKPKAFKPTKDRELSVSVLDGIQETDVWAAGHRVVVETRGKTLYGRADIGAVHVMEEKLKIIRSKTDQDDEHADIIDWPMDKAQCISIRQILASKANFIEI